MNELIQTIESVRAKLGTLRKHALKETPTRTIIIDPLLEALGWDVRDPDEVELEYPTVDGKSVDYALKINRKPVLLVEAKALDDPLNDVKAITQVVGYAANDGIVWCVLTNGVKWKVYRSVEKCPAPDKLMYEVSLDPRDSQEISVQDLARLMWRFSQDGMAKGTLGPIGEQTFTDGKIRKALDTLMRNPPTAFLNLVRKATGDDDLKPRKIRESLARICGKTALPTQGVRTTPPTSPVSEIRQPPGRGATQVPYDEGRHLAGKPQEVVELYRAIDRFCLSLRPGAIEKRVLKIYVAYGCAARGPRLKGTFCYMVIQQHSVVLYLRLKYARMEQPPSFARDVSSQRWGNCKLALNISSLAQFEQAAPLIRQSLETPA